MTRERIGDRFGWGWAACAAALLSVLARSRPAAADVFVGVGRAPSTFQAEPSIAVAGDVIVIGFNDKGWDPPPGETRVFAARSGYAYSLDRGASWTYRTGLPTIGDGDATGGDPGLVVCGGAFHYSYLYFRPGFGATVGLSRGTLVGDVLTWTPPRPVGVAADGIFDKPFPACDRSTGRVYVAYSRLLNGLNADSASRVEVVRSDDGGETWSPPTVVGKTFSYDPQGSALGAIPTVGPDGTLSVLWTRRKGQSVKQCFLATSSDGGASFGRTRRIPGCRTRPAPGTRGQLPHLAVDPRTPARLFVAWSAGDHRLGEVFVARSTNAGRTFRRAKATRGTRGTAQFMPWVAVDPDDGEVGVMWYDRRLQTTNQEFDVFFARSTNGRKFGQSVRVTTASSDPGPSGIITQIDDYITMAADGTGWHLAWTDERQGNLGIYYGFVPK